MPIAEVDGYPSEHFRHVYEDLICPSCKLANVRPVRADDVKQTNLIHLDILKSLIEAPIAICDLSTRNPNVLFELGIRQAFDKPVVLIQEEGTPRIFDISPLRYLEYSRELRYHEVIETQKRLSDSISATIAADGEAGNINSIVKLLAFADAARIPDLKGDKEGVALDFFRAEVQQIRKMIEGMSVTSRGSIRRDSVVFIEHERISSSVERIVQSSRTPARAKLEMVDACLADIERILPHIESRQEQTLIHNLYGRVQDLKGKLIKELEEIPF